MVLEPLLLIIIVLAALLLWIIKRLWVYKLGMICLMYFIDKEIGKEKMPKGEELKEIFSLALDKYIETMKKGRRYF